MGLNETKSIFRMNEHAYLDNTDPATFVAQRETSADPSPEKW